MKVILKDNISKLYEFLESHEDLETQDCALFERLVKRAKKQVLKKSSKSKTLADVKKDNEKNIKKTKEDSKQPKEKPKDDEPKIEFNTSSTAKKNTKDTKVVNLGPVNGRLLKKLVELLRQGPTRFSYKRKDGQQRNAIGTLEPEVVKKHIKGTGVKKPDSVLPYIELNPKGNGSPSQPADYNRAAWRSFRKNLLQSIKLAGM